ncbi:MAG: A/G-specific adenine glycosylase [Planctomycetota bacterium]
MAEKIEHGRVARALAAWFDTAARDLPWRAAGTATGRATRRDPYRVLVSEIMLQQTQVARVLEKFGSFVERFPTAATLAAASEDDVLAMWSGLGYYRRARLLHAAARAVVERHGGEVPNGVEELLALPGIGRYTAGAIATLAHGEPSAFVDGNVTRVLLRIAGREGRAGERATDAWAWEQMGALLEAADRPCETGEAVMELGATVCVPKGARCDRCPVAAHCAARASGRQEEIPLPKIKAKQKRVYAVATVDRDARGRVLVEQRPRDGMWAGLWQTPTVETDTEPETQPETEAGAAGVVAAFEYITTHRIFEVRVILGSGGRAIGGRRRVAVSELDGLGISNLQRRVIDEALQSDRS